MVKESCMSSRTYGSTTITLPSDTELQMSREFDAPAALVFEAYTTPEHVKRWWAAPDVEWLACEIDLRVGGAWRWAFRDADNQITTRSLSAAPTRRSIVRPASTIPRSLSHFPTRYRMSSSRSTRRMAGRCSPACRATPPGRSGIWSSALALAKARPRCSTAWLSC